LPTDNKDYTLQTVLLQPERSRGMSFWSRLFGRKEKKLNESRAVIHRLLSHIYLKEAECYAEVAQYDPEKKFVKFQVHVPPWRYVKIKIKDVTYIQHSVVLSELVYVFIYFLVRDGVLDLLSPDDFEHLADDYKLRFSGINLKISDSTPMSEDFYVEMKLKKITPRKKVVRIKKKKNKIIEREVAIAITSFLIQDSDGEDIGEGEIYNAAIFNEETKEIESK
jgi:hypothetical protein